ncbi:sigma-70 family RNA polymerase sigma factor [Microcoleus sp. FACHB-1515]|uniref:sigma-70 family RNA polymerase sigma factor n=1 Tax=Cyanophyceae TaxID=3028117 RepID=UPI001682218D|nr:sigma-70 family RNA polymerase sigma factor [Microcoleus sp. FACHB-1515]MBD2088577.1 sigma-70 family RNA polymerase sigma factor [Microcoleus sp. FACHB-1515]
MSEAERLRNLVEETCRHPAGSVKRQRGLTQIIRSTTPKLWRDYSPYYADALQQTWMYFCQNICEAKTGAQYDPNFGSVATWLNAYLKRRLQDGFIEQQKRATQTAQVKRSHSEEELDPVDNLAAEPDAPPILEDVKAWVEADFSGELRRVHIEGHPTVTVQQLILRRLPPETSWKALAAEFGLSVSTLSSFYQRQCLPRLRKFGESEGYL